MATSALSRVDTEFSSSFGEQYCLATSVQYQCKMAIIIALPFVSAVSRGGFRGDGKLKRVAAPQLSHDFRLCSKCNWLKYFTRTVSTSLTRKQH